MGDDMSGTILERLDRIEAKLTALVERQTIKDWYTTEEFAKIVGRDPFTVREWCRHGRINAKKQGSGRGKVTGWTELPVLASNVRR